MITSLSASIAFIFLLLGGIHFYWGFGGQAGKSVAVPEIGKRAAFVPSRFSTLAVACALIGCGGLIASTSGLLPTPLPRSSLRFLCYGLAILLTARAIGDFHLVGFFKRVREGRFARLDTLFYSPLCISLAMGIFMVARAG